MLGTKSISSFGQRRRDRGHRRTKIIFIILECISGSGMQFRQYTCFYVVEIHFKLSHTVCLIRYSIPMPRTARIFFTVLSAGLPLPRSISLIVARPTCDISARSCWVRESVSRRCFITSLSSIVQYNELSCKNKGHFQDRQTKVCYIILLKKDLNKQNNII